MNSLLDGDRRSWDLLLGMLLPAALAYSVFSLFLIPGYNDFFYELGWKLVSIFISIVVGTALLKRIRDDFRHRNFHPIAPAMVIVSSCVAAVHVTLAAIARTYMHYEWVPEVISTLLAFVVPLVALAFGIRFLVVARPGLAVAFLSLDFLVPVILSVTVVRLGTDCALFSWPELVYLIVNPFIVVNSLFVPVLIYAGNLKNLAMAWRTVAFAAVVFAASIAAWDAQSRPYFDIENHCLGHLLSSLKWLYPWL
jgi:hypothetical protein